jgi:hypothetical protein
VLLSYVISRADNGPKKGLKRVLLQIKNVNLVLIYLQDERKLDMARKSDAKEPENQEKKPAAEAVEKKGEKEEKSWLWRMIRENAQDFLILLSIILGLRPHPKEGETLPSGKQTPNWILSMFPSFTDEDEVEFNLTRDSHNDPLARRTEATFRENFIADGFDETKYRVRFIKFRREYLEQLRNPAPEDKSGGRLSFTRITLKDSATEFLTELITEAQAGGTPMEIYKRQRKMALDRKLLVKTGIFHWIRKHKTVSIMILLAAFVYVLSFVTLLIVRIFS